MILRRWMPMLITGLVSLAAACSAGNPVGVQDDGVGFRPADPRKPQSLGLVGLRERAQLMHGEVRIDSSPGHGTRVEARIPVQEELA